MIKKIFVYLLAAIIVLSMVGVVSAKISGNLQRESSIEKTVENKPPAAVETAKQEFTAKPQENIKKVVVAAEKKQVKPPIVSTKTSPAAKSTPPQKVQSIPLINRLKCLGDSEQAIIVQASSFKTYHVKVNTYEKVNGKWKAVLTDIPGVIGKNGFSTNRHEGDKTSPVGAFHFVTLLGWNGNPGFKMPFREATERDFWMSTGDINVYNTWYHHEGALTGQFDPKYSLAREPLFKYAAALDFNYGSQKVLGKGSGIFFHITPRSGGPTLGCTAISESRLLQVLKWMDPAKSPVIIQGPLSELNKM